jgi:Ca-activated chloride channel family protein
MLAVDTSGSMASDDVTPTRLAAAQKSATEFVAKLPRGFRIGLIGFDATARLEVPPTLDHQAVTTGIANLHLGTATAAGDAVFLALDAIGADAKLQASRIVLMSDGATTTGRPIADAGAAARGAKVPVSTISFGTVHGMVTIGGRTIAVPADKAAMQQLAELSGGQAFEAASGGELSSVYRGLAKQIGYTNQRKETTVTWVGGALVLACLGVGAGLAWGGRFL